MGLGPVIALEAPELWGGLIDLPFSDVSMGGTDNLLPLRAQSEAVVTELLCNEGEDQVALRSFPAAGQTSDGGSSPACKRFVARLRSQHSHAQLFQPQPQARHALCRPEGAYLITGGLGALGLACARFLFERGARCLVLSGRRASLSSLSSRQMRAIEELASAGARVRLLSADVADSAAMERGLRQTLEALGREDCQQQPRRLPLRGIIHAAGVAGTPQPLESISAQELDAVLRPKVKGAWVLHELSLKEPELEFFVTFSSVASLWPGARAPTRRLTHF